MRIDAKLPMDGVPADMAAYLKSLGYNNEVIRTDYFCTNGDVSKIVADKMPANCKSKPFKFGERSFDAEFTCAGNTSRIHMTIDAPEHYNMTITGTGENVSMYSKADVTFVSTNCPKESKSDPMPSFDAFLKDSHRVKPGHWEASVSYTSNIKEVTQRVIPRLPEDKRAAVQEQFDNLIALINSNHDFHDCISGELERGLMEAKLNDDCPLSKPRIKGDTIIADGVCKTPGATFSAELTRQDSEHYSIKVFQTVPAGAETITMSGVLKSHYVSQDCPAAGMTTPPAGAAIDTKQ
ncbi:hypothetical protein GCM10008942_35770 [Rhizomicrobium electricum]|uniref:Uncharacterized protein n=2 Tax=Rhizomicrobium electricum TaxID=480070 RepID=A0ABN1F6M5_9PROT